MQGDIVNFITRLLRSLNLTQSTRRVPIVALHRHQLGDGWDVAKCKKQVHSKFEKFVIADQVLSHPAQGQPVHHRVARETSQRP
jgi:hypothetical protein